MSLDEIKLGFFYSNGAYGRTWGVRQLAEIATDTETGETVFHVKGIACTCRRKKSHSRKAIAARLNSRAGQNTRLRCRKTTGNVWAAKN